MQKRKITEETLRKKEERHKKQGRGQGRGEQYKPRLYVGEFSSRGNCSRSPGIKTNRGHETFSDGETNFLNIFDASHIVTDILEQYPMNKDDTIRIAKECKIKHPTVPRSTFLQEMTTDFLIELTDKLGNVTYRAYAVKTREEINNPKTNYRTIEKLEIAKKYWKEKGIELGILIKDDITYNLITNINTIRYHMIHKTTSRMDPTTVSLIEELLLNYLADNIAIVLVTDPLDQKFSLKTGSALAILYSMIGEGRYSIDMHKLIDTSKPIKLTQKPIY